MTVFFSALQCKDDASFVFSHSLKVKNDSSLKKFSNFATVKDNEIPLLLL